MVLVKLFFLAALRKHWRLLMIRIFLIFGIILDKLVLELEILDWLIRPLKLLSVLIIIMLSLLIILEYNLKMRDFFQVLELRKGNVEQARSNFDRSSKLGQFLFEPSYNGGLLAFKTGEYQDSFTATKKALEIFPEHADSKELMKGLKQHFSII